MAKKIPRLKFRLPRKKSKKEHERSLRSLNEALQAIDNAKKIRPETWQRVFDV